MLLTATAAVVAYVCRIHNDNTTTTSIASSSKKALVPHKQGALGHVTGAACRFKLSPHTATLCHTNTHTHNNNMGESMYFQRIQAKGSVPCMYIPRNSSRQGTKRVVCCMLSFLWERHCCVLWGLTLGIGMLGKFCEKSSFFRSKFEKSDNNYVNLRLCT